MYYYALINSSTNVIDAVCINAEAARSQLNELQEKMIVRPIMLEADYGVLSKDYKGFEQNKPFILYLDLDGYTVFGPVILVENWSFWSHLKNITPLVQQLEMPKTSISALMLCVDSQSDTIQMSICAPSYGLHIRFPALTKKEIVRHWMKDSFSQEKHEYGLLFDTAVLRLIPDYISSNELHVLRNEFIASLKRI